MLVSINWKRNSDQKGFLHVFTNNPKDPWFVSVDSFPANNVEVPTNTPYDALIIYAFEHRVTEEGRNVANHAGTVTVSAADIDRAGKATVHLKYDDGLEPPDAELQISFHDDLPQGDDFPDSADMKRTYEELVNQAKTWIKKYPPLVKDLQDLSVFHYLNRYPKMPACFFGIQKTVKAEHEALFLSAIAIALNRRGESMQDFMVSDTFASVITGEALAAITNCQVYNADTELLSGGGKKEIDEFSADERVLGNGDCEDYSHEICMLACSLKHGNYTHKVVLRAQAIMKQYTILLTLGEVSMDDNDPNLKRYQAGDYFAHAFIILVQKLPPARGVEPVKINPDGFDKKMKNLAEDGISLFDAQPFSAQHRMTHWITGLRKGDARLRRMESIGLHYYMYPFSAIIVDDDLLSSTYETPIHEIGFLQMKDGKLHRGCEFKKLIDGDPDVYYVPTCEMTREQYDDAKRCMLYFHPITPYETDAEEPDLSLLEAVLGIQRQLEILPNTISCFFIQGPDCFDKQYLQGLKTRMKNIDNSYYVLDFFAKDVFTIEVLGI